jgi:hypothetical protein
MTRLIGVEPDCPFSPGLLEKISYAGAQSSSFVQAAKDLQVLAEVEVTAKRIERWTKRIGDQRVAELEGAAAAYQELPLPEQRTSPTDQVPQVACVQMDGGRIQIRTRHEVPHKEEGQGYWRESLVGCLLSMTSVEHTEDPCPTIPPSFVDPARMSQLGREIKGFSSSEDHGAGSSEDASPDRAGRPEVLVRSVVATRQGIDVFGQRLVAAAHRRGFHAARRKVFVADGAASNWSVHRRHFSHYTPVLDFTHAVCYVYAAAMAGRSFAAGWAVYCQWAQWLWEGATGPLIAAIARRAQELGPPEEGDSETSPRKVIAETERYLQNQRSRMKYAEYRKLGLPITSSHIESTIKQINRRVKGSEKFWDQGAEPLLQLAADHLSETHELWRFWKNRPRRLHPMRCYHAAA